jgi:alkylation response protein AidB-like acyl-CoA dehydrogenase
MYDLHLTAEQLEFRDTVREFAEKEMKPPSLHPDRLQPFEKPLLREVLDKASELGLRTLALSEAAGGAGADTLTACIVLEELAAGDIDVAVALAHTSALGQVLFDRLMTPGQRERWLTKFVEDQGFHLACAARDPEAGRGWNYHNPEALDEVEEPVAVKQGSDWVINGSAGYVANAPIAGLFAVQVRTGGAKGKLSTVLVPREAKGLTVGQPVKAVGDKRGDGEDIVPWQHGIGAEVKFKDCKVPADHLLGKEGASPLADGAALRQRVTQLAAINLGLGRAAYDTAVEYSRIRRQGGRNIIEHQAIGTKLADCTIKLELARNMIWKAAWIADHPEAVADRSVPELPLHTIARVYTAEAVHDVTLLAAECFGAMGVMRDMPLQKYVHDGFIFLNADSADGAMKLNIAEAVAGYRRPLAA